MSTFSKMALEEIKLVKIYAKEVSNSEGGTTVKVFFDVKYKMQIIKGISCCFPNNPDKNIQALTLPEEVEEGEEQKENKSGNNTQHDMKPALELIQ